MAAADRPALLEALRADPDRTGVFVDFDGTLSAIVDDPAEAVPRPGVVEVLTALAARYACVAVLSGRPVDFLQGLFPAGVDLAGLYGLEAVVGGVRRDHPLGGDWRRVVGELADRAEAEGPDGMRVESKGISLTLHYRGRPERQADVRAWAERQAAHSGLELRPARMSYELHPPIEVDKGTALDELAGGLSAVCFVGDDVGDLPAFDALDRLAAQGLAVARVGVRSAEGSAELLERADLVVDGPDGAVAFLADLIMA